MKLLLDANLSYRLVKKLQHNFPACLHVTKTGLPVPAKDIDIWMWAKNNAYTLVVSNDEDFLHLLEQHGPPPKLVLLRIGNQSTQTIANILLKSAKDIEHLYTANDIDVLEILTP